jgi:hypothetical protein
MNLLFGTVDPLKDPGSHGDCPFRGIGRFHSLHDFPYCAMGNLGPGFEGQSPYPEAIDHGDLRLTHHRSHGRYNGLPVSSKVKESGGYHITGSAMKGIEDKQTHKSPVPINPCVYDF